MISDADLTAWMVAQGFSPYAASLPDILTAARALYPTPARSAQAALFALQHGADTSGYIRLTVATDDITVSRARLSP